MKAFASDFDGTLYFQDRTEPISSADIDAIKKFQSLGHAFGFCTGRTLEGILESTKDSLEPDFYITNSGACILDKDLRIVFEKTLPKELVNKVIQYGIKNGYMVDIHMDGKYFAFGQPNAYASNVLKTLDDVNGNVHNISYDAVTFDNAQQLAAEINRMFSNQIIAYQNVQFVDVVPLNCSKGSGIDFVHNLLKVDTFGGIGDSMNDLPMLERVDVPFTFLDAPKELLENAAQLVSSVAEAVDFML